MDWVSLGTMDPFVPLPCPPGESAFHIKGVVLNGLLEYIEKNVHGGAEAAREHVRDPAIRTFLEQTFLAGGWYDFLPVLHFLGATAQAANLSAEDFIAAHAKWQAERDVHGIYRVLLKVSSPEAVGKRLPNAYARYFDFGRVETLSLSRTASEVLVSGLPTILLDWYKVSVGAAAVAMLELAGARGVTSHYLVPEPDGSKGGVPTVRFRVRRTWKS